MTSVIYKLKHKRFGFGTSAGLALGCRDNSSGGSKEPVLNTLRGRREGGLNAVINRQKCDLRRRKKINVDFSSYCNLGGNSLKKVLEKFPNFRPEFAGLVDSWIFLGCAFFANK